MSAAKRLNEEQIYEQIAVEIAEGAVKAGLCTQAIAQADGNEARIEACYIKLRFQNLKDEMQAAEAAAFQKARDDEKKAKEQAKKKAASDKNREAFLSAQEAQRRMEENRIDLNDDTRFILQSVLITLGGCLLLLMMFGL